MCHAMITRTPKNGDEPLEYMKRRGWTKKKRDAYKVSEEDAKVFARQLAIANQTYSYDYTTISD